MNDVAEKFVENDPENYDQKNTEPEDMQQIVGFKIESELFGVDILTVQEIVKNIPITIVPAAPEFIKGVINLRGNIIPVIDLRKWLNMEKTMTDSPADAWILVLNINERIAGFRVDTVSRVMKVPSRSIIPPPEMFSSGLKSDYISGVFKTDDRLAAILDFNRILLVGEIKKLSASKRQEKKS
ncbi:MAG: purine-binding chemotaxis protein CheW [Desulfobacteraceae bacterium]|nr:purine-binding chemotaxis protein CheW [Desulfobacteraceae bacterium]